jgi:hypothetical protein
MIPLQGSISQIILDRLEGKTTIEDAFTYGEVYQKVCTQRGRKVSRRDFQKELDKLHDANWIQIEKDPHNRKKTLIFLTPVPSEGLAKDYNRMLAWRLKDFLVDSFVKEHWLMPIELVGFWGRHPDETYYLSKNKSYDLEKLIHDSPFWRRYSLEEAKDIISISKATWPRIYEKCGKDTTLLKKRIGECWELMIKVNVQEIIQAWLGKREINRKNIRTNLRKTLALYANDGVPEIMDDNYWLTSMKLKG